jgi:hypothetical protein
MGRKSPGDSPQNKKHLNRTSTVITSPMVKGRLVRVLKHHTMRICGEEKLKLYRILILAMHGNGQLHDSVISGKELLAPSC